MNNDAVSVKLEFHPEPSMKFILYLIGASCTLLATLPWSIPLGLTMVPEPSRSLFFMLLIVLLATIIGFIVWWAPKYYSSIEYSVGPDWLKAEGGVFWRKRSRLPMDRLQLVTVAQGPLQRALGVASLRVFTAATGHQDAELVFVNIKDAEPLRDRILALAAACHADRNGLGAVSLRRDEGVVLEEILNELKVIGKSLEEWASRR